ncbi:MAG: FtsX-like permease family protein [Syntrophaceae bacterium]
MAWRNLWRNRRRTLITLVAIAFGFLLSVSFTVFSDGYYGQMIDAAARMGAGNLTLQPLGYQTKPEAGKVIADTPVLIRTVLKTAHVRFAAERVISQGMAGTAVDTTGAGILGIDPAAEGRRLFILDHVVQGSGLTSTSGSQALVGSLMARQLELKIGRKFVITTTDRHGNVVSGLLKVCGVFTTGVDEVDRSIIVAPIDYLRALVGYAPSEATQVAVFLDSARHTDAVCASLSLAARAHRAEALSWQVMMPDLAGLITLDKAGNYFFQTFIFLLIMAGILDTVLMGVMERLREFGVMLAVGMTPGRVWSLIMLETFWLGVVGLIVGALVSIPVYWYLHSFGVDLSPLMQEKQVAGGVVLDLFIRARFQAGHIANIFGGVFALILVAGLYPAFLAARTRPVETMKII